MLLKKLVFQHFGPFASRTELELEDDVTVLTGANDTGKTSVLSLIQRVCGVKRPDQLIQESEVNLDRIGDSIPVWDQDSDISCEAYFKGTEHSQPHVTGDWGNGDEIHLLCVLPPKARKVSIKGWRKQATQRWSSGGDVQLRSLPITIRLPLTEEIGTIIDLENPNPNEKCFLQAAFGQQFVFAKYAGMTEGTFSSHLSKAQGDINERLRRFAPANMSFQFHFHTVNTDRKQLSIQLRDAHSGHTPFGLRGAGVRRLISLMGSLLCQPFSDGHYVILLDEPETSLHADAQHTFRRVLEEMAQKKNIQVVYATHSSSMINTMRPSSLRVLRRTNIGERATSEIVDRVGDGNFIAVRSSLGITAADSLLFAPVTIIVEGATEVYGLPLALRRLNESEVNGFEDVPKVLGLVHLLDGCGDEFEYLCRLAKSQGTKPIIFLDGDKHKRVPKLRTQHSDVPVIQLTDNEEFEQLVPTEVYFEALRLVTAEFVEIDNEKLTADCFRDWETTVKLAPQMAFSKKIDRWLGDAFGISLEKPRTMKRALEIVDPNQINPEPFKRLIFEARKLLSP